MANRIFLSPPCMGGGEQRYVEDAFATNWIAPSGPHIDQFENEMAAYVGVQSALALSSGTAAIHLALRRFGVQAGDTVFCQDFTFIGSCNGVLYEKAVPIFIDSEDKSWNMCPAALENAFRWAKANSRMPKAVIICDLYGEPADWDSLLPVCRKYGVPVVEDAAEAVGAVYRGIKCGAFGDIGVFSFNGNKLLTTSGGGMLLSDDAAAIEKARFWSAQAREPVIWYEHKELGYNYRMSNICAAIGLGQLEFLPEKLRIRKKTHETYKAAFAEIPVHIKEMMTNGAGNHWLNLLVVDSGEVASTAIVNALLGAGIECRPAWKPMHMQPLFHEAVFVTERDVYTRGEDCIGTGRSVDERLFARSVCLPSGDTLTEEQIREIVHEIGKHFV